MANAISTPISVLAKKDLLRIHKLLRLTALPPFQMVDPETKKSVTVSLSKLSGPISLPGVRHKQANGYWRNVEINKNVRCCLWFGGWWDGKQAYISVLSHNSSTGRPHLAGSWITEFPLGYVVRNYNGLSYWIARRNARHSNCAIDDWLPNGSDVEGMPSVNAVLPAVKEQLRSLGSRSPRSIGLQPVVTSSQENEFLKRTLRFIVRVAVTACAYKDGSLSMSRFTKKQKRTSGQGWGLTPKERKAVEEYAIKEAMTHYRKWKPRKTEREGIGADLEIIKGGRKEWVEVKGTTGELPRFDFYKTEIERFRQQPTRTHLFALLRIKLNRVLKANGGAKYVRKAVGKDILNKKVVPEPISYRVDFGEY